MHYKIDSGSGHWLLLDNQGRTIDDFRGIKFVVFYGNIIKHGPIDKVDEWLQQTWNKLKNSSMSKEERAEFWEAHKSIIVPHVEPVPSAKWNSVNKLCGVINRCLATSGLAGTLLEKFGH